ncbi:MAG: hypothetical protein KDD52_07375 [Bdellovibrionales bacterium]|nr:hypothetical protein [Bdellovibrionales bacterium]
MKPLDIKCPQKIHLVLNVDTSDSVKHMTPWVQRMIRVFGKVVPAQDFLISVVQFASQSRRLALRKKPKDIENLKLENLTVDSTQIHLALHEVDQIFTETADADGILPDSKNDRYSRILLSVTDANANLQTLIDPGKATSEYYDDELVERLRISIEDMRVGSFTYSLPKNLDEQAYYIGEQMKEMTYVHEFVPYVLKIGNTYKERVLYHLAMQDPLQISEADFEGTLLSIVSGICG